MFVSAVTECESEADRGVFKELCQFARKEKGKKRGIYIGFYETAEGALAKCEMCSLVQFIPC